MKYYFSFLYILIVNMSWFVPVADNDPRLKNRTFSFGLPDFGLDDGVSDAVDDLFFDNDHVSDGVYLCSQVTRLVKPDQNYDDVSDDLFLCLSI